MTPNFDNSMALIPRGYADDLNKIANPLIGQFHKLLSRQNIAYPHPILIKKNLEDMVNATVPDAKIRSEYVD